MKKFSKVKEPGYIQVDTIHRFINGMKFYIFNGLDLYTKFQSSYAYRSPSSKNGVDFLKKFIKVFPLKGGFNTVQNDNGSEFMEDFDLYLKKNKTSILLFTMSKNKWIYRKSK